MTQIQQMMSDEGCAQQTGETCSHICEPDATKCTLKDWQESLQQKMYAQQALPIMHTVGID